MNKKEITSSYNRALKLPSLYWSELINIDRLSGKEKRVNFSKKASNYDFEKLKYKNEPLRYTKRHILKEIDNIPCHKERLIMAFEHADGIELPALNLLCANYLKEKFIKETAYNYFVNRYLQNFSMDGLKLSEKKNKNIFNRFTFQPKEKKQIHREMVSVIMPAFNNEKTVTYAAKSILNQTHRNLELIIVDDCSTDNTYNTCLELQKHDNRIKVLRNHENSGAYYSRNHGLKLSQGDYVTILDADDWSFPERLQIQISRLKNEDAVAHLGYYLRLTEEGFITGFRIKGKYSYDGALHKCLASLMIKKDYLDSYLGYWDSVRFGADSEMYNRILSLKNGKLIEDITPLMLALERDDSLTRRPESALGNKARSSYAKAFLEWHENIDEKNSKLEFPLKERPFSVDTSML
ncbi:glycosyltransferase family A protein [Oceanimonas sp. AH20CE76]|uniref:glycosyltransferase family 2 protein n=1 Tax=Oceanimonas sp. AH20CE76 TaxID=2977120 RepID=UPI0031FF01FD